MADLPEDWGLSKRHRDDGKLDIVGKQDDGREYIAMTTCQEDITPWEVEGLAAGDRTQTTAREFATRATAQVERNRAEYEARMEEDFLEPAEIVAHAGLHKGSRTLGWTRRYARNWGSVFGNKEDA